MICDERECEGMILSPCRLAGVKKESSQLIHKAFRTKCVREEFYVGKIPLCVCCHLCDNDRVQKMNRWMRIILTTRNGHSSKRECWCRRGKLSNCNHNLDSAQFAAIK